jgi:signal transduction histidine kinase
MGDGGARDEISQVSAALDAMLDRLQAAFAAQTRFVQDASHELRTPLTSVLASLELLSEELSGEQADTAEAALRSARRMGRLVADLLLLARVDAKRARPHEPTALDEVLTEAAAEIGPVAEDHALEIDAAPAVVSGVRDDLHRLVLNLIENAVKHTPPGTHVRASTATRNGEALLMVEDDGPGIPEELQSRLFDRFVRGAGDRSAAGGDRGRGSGLGLSIVRAVAQSHGGSVAFESANGRGARFVVRLPSMRAPLPEPNGDHTSTTTGSTIGRRRSRS